MELGSDYELSLEEIRQQERNFYHYFKDVKYQLFDSGRSAVKTIPIGKKGRVLLPEYICESMIKSFIGREVVFYNINSDFTIDIEDLYYKLSSDTLAIVIVHYFGGMQPQEKVNRIRQLAKQQEVVLIEDMTQSLFSFQTVESDYWIASIRKWLPVPMGGMLACHPNQRLTEDIDKFPQSSDSRLYPMLLKHLFIKEGFDCHDEYRRRFVKTESSLDEQKEIYRMSDLTKFLLGCFDIPSMIERRKSNYNQVLQGLSNLGLLPALKIQEQDCPLVYPIRVRKRDEFRKYLMDNKIYCAVHWPFDGFQADQRKEAKKNAENLISLPIDQRYNSEQINYMVEAISRYGGDLLF